MRPAGVAEVDAAKADGRWEAAYEPQRFAGVPAELAAALDGNPAAGAAFEQLGRSERYLLMLPLLKLLTSEARAKALARILAQLGR
ncbi:MAG: YdeI/OmpD-associated family protein [Specibacter sp.]